jgi:4-diphosphocytidyl-2C-methyl-D-erythritol kinase
VRPRFGVSSAEAYTWYDTETRPISERSRRAAVARGHRSGQRLLPDRWPEWAINLKNDLEAPVTAHHPTISRIKTALVEAGAIHAAMSGSGSAVFGLFDRADAAKRTARDLNRPGWQVLCSRTLSRAEYARELRPVLAGRRKSRIS